MPKDELTKFASNFHAILGGQRNFGIILVHGIYGAVDRVSRDRSANQSDFNYVQVFPR